MFRFEALTIGFFAVLGAAALFIRASRAHRFRAALWSAAVIAGVLVAVQVLAPAARVWLGPAYLVLGYWLPALMIPAHSAGGFEAWLARTDEWCRLHPVAAPSWLLYVLELSYLVCYALVPAAFTCVWMYGRLADSDRFWTAVLMSGFVCYGSLPWLVSRPPRVQLKPDTTIEGKPDAPIKDGAVKAHAARTGLRAVNEFVLARVSHGLNTFPSGHVAVSVAAALEVMSVSRPAGLAMMGVAAGIAGGAVAGRYHYAVDVASGIVVGIAASSLV